MVVSLGWLQIIVWKMSVAPKSWVVECCCKPTHPSAWRTSQRSDVKVGVDLKKLSANLRPWKTFRLSDQPSSKICWAFGEKIIQERSANGLAWALRSLSKSSGFFLLSLPLVFVGVAKMKLPKSVEWIFVLFASKKMRIARAPQDFLEVPARLPVRRRLWCGHCDECW